MGWLIDLKIAEEGFDLLILSIFRFGLSTGHDKQGSFICFHIGIWKFSIFTTFQLGGLN